MLYWGGLDLQEAQVSTDCCVVDNIHIISILKSWRMSCKIEIHGLVFTDLSVNLFFLQVKDSSINFCQISSSNSDANLEVRLETPSSSSSPETGGFGQEAPVQIHQPVAGL